MKPKDLLQHLEKGDRTMYHLTKKPQSGPTLGSINQAFGNAFTTAAGQLFGGGQLVSTSAAGNIFWNGGNQMAQRSGIQGLGGGPQW